VAELPESGAEAIGVSADITSAADVMRPRQRTEAELSPTDISEDEWREVID
jgi:hypothetical protein